MDFSEALRPCVPAEHDDIQQAVAHKPVPAMDAAHHLTGCKQIFNVRLAVGGDFYAAVLIVQGGIDQNRLLADVDAVLGKHPHHGGDALFNGPFAIFQLDHRRIQPHGGTGRVGTPFPRAVHSRMMKAADTSRVSRGFIKASPSALMSIAPTLRTFSVTSAP